MRNPKLGRVDHSHIALLAEQAVASRRGWSGGMRMADETPEEKAAREAAEKAAKDKADADLGEVTIDGKVHKVADLQRIMADEKRQGKRSGERTILEKLGFEKPEDAEAFVKAARDRDKAAMTEAERKAAEADEAKAAAAKERAEAAADRRETAIERALVRLGVNDDDLDDAAVLLAPKLAADADAAAIKLAAEELKTRREELFTGTIPPTTRRRAGELPGGRPGDKPRPQGEEFGAEGRARAARRFGDRAGKA